MKNHYPLLFATAIFPLAVFLLGMPVNGFSQCTPSIPGTAILITTTTTVGNGGVHYWVCAPANDTLFNGGGGCTFYVESYGNVKGSGSGTIYLKNCASFDANGGGSNTIYYEPNANIINAGGGPTLIPCTNIYFDYTNAPAGSCDTTNCICNTSSTITPTACDSFVSPSGNYTWTISNTYMDTIPNAALCDSVITIDLTVDSSYAVNDSTSINQGDSALIHGSYESVAGIYYDTLIAANGCDSIVATTLTVLVGVDESTISNSQFIIHPNPTTGVFTVQGATGTIEVLDLFGRLVLRTNEPQIDMSHRPKGVYLVKAGQAVRKLVLH